MLGENDMNNERKNKEWLFVFAIAGYYFIAAMGNWYFYFNPPVVLPRLSEPTFGLNEIIRIITFIGGLYLMIKTLHLLTKIFWGFLSVNSAAMLIWSFINSTQNKAVDAAYLSVFSIILLALLVTLNRKNIELFDWYKLKKQKEANE